MTISEGSRHRLHQRLDELLGPDEAATLMEHLPPVGWADVATKRDLEHLRTGLESKIDQLGSDLRAELARFGAELHREIGMVRGEIGMVRGETARQLPTMLFGLLGLQLSAAGLVVAVSRLL